MNVFLLRHGKAEEVRAGGDAGRKLTRQGRDDIATVARWMADQDFEFERIATSPFARARETAEIVAATLDMPDHIEIWEMLVPGGSPDTICHELGRFSDDPGLLLVGHEPLLSALISRIISGDPGSGIVMTKGGLAKIRDFSFSRRPAGELHWLLTARQIAGMMK